MRGCATGTEPCSALMDMIKGLVGDEIVKGCVVEANSKTVLIVVEYYVNPAIISTKKFEFDVDEELANGLVELLGEHIKSFSYTVSPGEFDILYEVKYCPEEKSNKLFKILQAKIDKDMQ